MPSSSNVLRNPRMEHGSVRILVPLPGTSPDTRAALVYSENDVRALCAEAAASARATAVEELAARRTRQDAEAARVFEALGLATTQLQEAERSWSNECVDRLIFLALQIARRVVRAELQLRPEALVESVGDLLERASRSRQRTLRLSPADHGRLLDGGFDLATIAPRLEVLADPGIEAGGALLETETSHWDAQLDSMFDGLEQRLREALGAESNADTKDIPTAAESSPQDIDDAHREAA